MKAAPSLDDVAGAILDGTAVDWTVVESGSAPADQPVVNQLKTLAALRLVSRRADITHGPTSWGHLRVFERIGRGAFGEVYRAWDTRLDREVALKLLPAESGRADTQDSTVIEEGRLLARVRHPNVVTIYGAERIDGRIGLWMEFVKGRTLEESLRGGATFSAQDVTRLGVELCQAVAAVHAAGLLHRDIKAQNVMVTDNGRLVLMDFGTGRELDGPSEAHTAGTPLYLAPEVLSGAAATARSEVYSVGVLLYRLLTGDYPVKGRDLAELRRAHEVRLPPTRSAPRRPGKADTTVRLKPDPTRIAGRLGRVIARALHPDPDRRYESAAALAGALTATKGIPRWAYAMAAALAIVAGAWVPWQLRTGALLAPSSSAVAAGVPTEAPVIAVMPFKNLSAEPDSDFFVDGLTSEVIRNLAVIDGLQVRSQTSSFSFKDTPRNVATIGKQLGVNLIVEADVQRVGNRLRINAQLVRVAGDVPLWSERFDRTLKDVFAIQDEISLAIVNKLRLTLGRGQRRYQTNLEAYELYLKGLARVRQGRTEGGRLAMPVFEQVIALDPGFAPAHAGLASAYAAMAWQISGGLSTEKALAGMRPAAARALELDPLLAEGHAAMGLTGARERNWENAARSFERALELNPSLATTYTDYAWSTLLPTGQWAKARGLLETALTIDPLSLDVKWVLAQANLIEGRYQDAVSLARQVLADVNGPLLLMRALTFAGRPEDAIAAWQDRPEPDRSGSERWLATAYVMAGRKKELARLIEAHRNEHPYRQALIYAALGDKERTINALNRAVETFPQRTAQTLVYPEMAFLRGDPRLAPLRKKLNLP